MIRKFAYSSIYIVDILGVSDSLIPEELIVETGSNPKVTLKNNTASQLFQSLSTINLKIPLYYVKIYNIPMLKAFLQSLEEKIKNNLEAPILHFECHGSADKGMHFPVINKFLSWVDLNILFVQLNKELRNNLLIVIAGCDSSKLLTNIIYSDGSPFGCFVGSKVVTYEGIIKRFKDFYRQLFFHNDLEFAYDIVKDDFVIKFSVDICLEHLLLPIVLNYLGNDRRNFVEFTVNQLIKNGQEGTLKHIRKIAKSRLKNLEYFYDLSAKRFLHGSLPIPFDQAITIATELKKILADESKYDNKLALALQQRKYKF
ncbi:hypothetical protein ACQIBV_004712 [Yersinia enterocolitica]|nr:hypothetical protein [Yersinia enterocolitica]EKN4061730.1 hypothetical protein [Yersinia enterocolitica]